MSKCKGGMILEKETIPKPKRFYFLYLPVLYFVGLYLFYLLLTYLFTDNSLTSPELIYLPLINAIFLSLLHWGGDWIDSISPKPKNSQSKKSLKELKQQFIVNGTSFNKLMITIYSLCIVIVIVIISLTVIGVL